MILKVNLRPDERAAIIGQRFDHHAKFGICRNFESLSRFDRFDASATGERNIQLAAYYLHELFIAGVEFVFTRLHDPQGFFRTIGKDHRAADDFTSK